MSVRTVPGALDILNQKLGGNAGDIPASSTKEFALEKIYRTLGGEESLEGVNTTSEIIEKIAGVAEGGGEGGGGELETAEVSINIAGVESDATAKLSNVIVEANPPIIPFSVIKSVDIAQLTQSTVFTVILLDGKAFLEANHVIGTEGDISVGQIPIQYTITGDCSITIKGIGGETEN